MKRTMFLMLTAVLLAGMVGCAAHRGKWSCADGTCVNMPGGCAQAGDCCGSACEGRGSVCEGRATDGAACDDCNGHCGLWAKLCGWCKCKHGHKGPGRPPQDFNAGPPAAQVAYPYYTVRGPRDFLAKNPSSIGP
jgi:hypothetical protein